MDRGEARSRSGPDGPARRIRRAHFKASAAPEACPRQGGSVFFDIKERDTTGVSLVDGPDAIGWLDGLDATQTTTSHLVWWWSTEADYAVDRGALSLTDRYEDDEAPGNTRM